MTVVELARPGRPERGGSSSIRPKQWRGWYGICGAPGCEHCSWATGTGKTLVSIRVADGLGARLVLFVVPTLDLAVQAALAWRRDGHLEHMVIVFSLDTAGRDGLVVARIMSTTDPHALGGLMSVVGESPDNGKLRLERASLPHATAMGEGRSTACRRALSVAWSTVLVSRHGTLCSRLALRLARRERHGPLPPFDGLARGRALPDGRPTPTASVLLTSLRRAIARKSGNFHPSARLLAFLTDVVLARRSDGAGDRHCSVIP